MSKWSRKRLCRRVRALERAANRIGSDRDALAALVEWQMPNMDEAGRACAEDLLADWRGRWNWMR